MPSCDKRIGNGDVFRRNEPRRFTANVLQRCLKTATVEINQNGICTLNKHPPPPICAATDFDFDVLDFADCCDGNSGRRLPLKMDTKC